MDAGAVAADVLAKIGGFFDRIGDVLQATQIPQQVKDVDAAGLFTNPWFLIPFIALIGYQVYKQAFRDMIIMGLLLGVWYVSGTPYMQNLVVGNELQMNKVLPLLFGGAVVLGIIIYLLFGRSD